MAQQSTNCLYDSGGEVMKTTNLERAFIVGVCLALNKLFLCLLIGAGSIFVLLVAFVLLILNFMILAKTVDKLIDAFEELKRE